MRLKKIAASSLAICAMTVLPLAAPAQSSDDAQQAAQTADTQGEAQADGGRHREWHGSSPFKEFEQTLTSDQKQEMSEIRQKARAESGPLRQQIRSLREQLSADPKPENSAELQNQLESLHEQLRSQMEANHEQMMAILTDTQKVQLEKIRQQHRHLRGGNED
jgi:Spy/CpxP family protein refolding chaperone